MFLAGGKLGTNTGDGVNLPLSLVLFHLGHPVLFLPNLSGCPLILQEKDDFSPSLSSQAT